MFCCHRYDLSARGDHAWEDSILIASKMKHIQRSCVWFLVGFALFGYLFESVADAQQQPTSKPTLDVLAKKLEADVRLLRRRVDAIPSDSEVRTQAFAAIKEDCKRDWRSWERQLCSYGSIDSATRLKVATTVLKVLGDSWQILGVAALNEFLAEELSASRKSLLAGIDDEVRRRFLCQLAAAWAKARPRQDLEALLSVMQWSVTLQVDRHLSQKKLKKLGGDLLTVFTEISPTIWTSLASSKPAKAARVSVPVFGDHGLDAELKDGGNQIRHFSWAFWTCTRCPTLADAEWLMTMKEKIDARRRGQKINKADLKLNRRAINLVMKFKKMAGQSDAVRTTTRPAIDIVALIRKELQ